ncbi:alpha/beta hydrolase [Nocardia sp. CDC159]|uniref:Alpha/beta hydrolase n=1 Tax=Nocardia pulmonis TaxID=2951408 RepID=A0A9X2EHD4_9NOCA|nr:MULTISPECIES: alpha/beta hydrolase [Nocardia]MCM6778273.1 alpha/beta hydrolase [Nocardia pulmonis]MCM6791162.1 alpha/beta hydrolase [Nocardia sp. CDC159]
MSEPDLDREYSPSSVARDPAGSLRRYRMRSDAARSRLDVHLAVRYGEERGERCHVFPAAPAGIRGPRTPVLVFVHGGHWQESGIEEACFAAEHAVAHGCAFVAVGYGLAPARKLPDMIGSVARALDWLTHAGPLFGIDPERIHVAGSSAGAHLLAAALAVGATPRVRSACLLSGLYDLTEIPRTYVNDALRLTPGLARDCSPLGMPAPPCDAVLLAAGQYETRTYLRQHERYAEYLAARSIPVTSLIVPDRDHFDLALDLADPATPLGRETLSQLAPMGSRTREGTVTSAR